MNRHRRITKIRIPFVDMKNLIKYSIDLVDYIIKTFKEFKLEVVKEVKVDKIGLLKMRVGVVRDIFRKSKKRFKENRNKVFVMLEKKEYMKHLV